MAPIGEYAYIVKGERSFTSFFTIRIRGFCFNLYLAKKHFIY